MKREAFLNYYIYNGEQYATENMEVFDHIPSPIIYEVIRIIDGVPLFLEDHVDRLRKSGDILGIKVNKSDEEIAAEILKLIKINGYKNMNVKLLCSNLYEENQDFFTYYIESHYPEKEVYEKGIHTILYYSERENPNAKIINLSLREGINLALKGQNAYEALLVNKEGCITEGSRSNMFFVKGDKLFTAPAGDVLLGVTRKVIMKVCKSLNINVIEACIYENDLTKLDGAFMSGTSVNVLPISSINEIKINSVQNEMIDQIAKGYMKEMENYIQNSSVR